MTTVAGTADLTALAETLSRTAGMSVRTAAEQIVGQTATTVQQLASAKAPRRTGRLAQSITVRRPSKLAAAIGPTASYGAYQEFGTASRGEFGGSPYVIRARPGGKLVFTVGGRKVVTNKVVHPGVPPSPYLRPALVEAIGPMAGQLADAGALSILRGPPS